MSKAGVHSNRGDGYQTLVAFDWALSILTNKDYLWLEVDSTSLDAIGDAISVDDIVIGCADGGLICCQCKKNQTDFKPWSVADLGEELLKAAQFLVDNKNSKVKFYSRSNFGALSKLREHSETQPNEIAYKKSLSNEHQRTDKDLEKQISKVAGLSTYDFLKRTAFSVSPEFDDMERQLRDRLNFIVSNGNIVYDVLWTKLDKLGARINSSHSAAQPSHRLTKKVLREALENSGATLTPTISQQDMQHTFAAASAIGRNWKRDIAGKRLQSFAVSELITIIESVQRSVLLTGIPGSGKTCTLLELQDVLEKRNDLATLFIQAREYANCKTPDARIAQGLPDDLVGLVGRMADSKPTVVIVDSLDVLSLSREHDALSFFLAQIDRLLLIPNITVIAACREFDRKYDSRLAERTWGRIVSNPPLDWEEVVAPIITDFGIDPATLDQTSRRLLQNPRELAMFADIAQKTGGFNFATSQALSRKYLETIVQNDPRLGDNAMKGIENIAEKMLTSRRLYIPRRQTEIPDEMLKRMLSAEVLHENQSGNIEFGHQTLLDVLVVGWAERISLSLKRIIEKLPAVPFVRPTIRAYVAYLGAGDRINFRKQLRAVFDSNIAFHIRRLVAESFAEQTPQDDDWSLIKHLHSQHRELFTPLYMSATSLEWHYFWLKFLVPYVLLEKDAQSLAAHVQRIDLWKKDDPSGLMTFWTLALQQAWANQDYIARNLAIELDDSNFHACVNTAPLIETLLKFHRRDHDLLGHALALCVDAGHVDDELLWSYIAGDITQEDILKHHFEKKLRCDPHVFKDRDFLNRRMLESERLLDLAIDAVEKWSEILNGRYSYHRELNENFLSFTSYETVHSQHVHSHVSAENVLLQALENAIQHHAEKQSGWWITNRHRLCRSYETAIRYIVILALTEHPENNIAEVTWVLTDQGTLKSKLRYEIGNLINSSFIYLSGPVQDTVMSTILTLWEDEDIVENPWILTVRVELLSSIPIHLRTNESDNSLPSWEKINGLYVREPRIQHHGGMVRAPFSYERFLEWNDAAILKILSHYLEDYHRNSFDDLLVGGAYQVKGQLREASSRSPKRFMRFLVANWGVIPDRFRDGILEGAATYLDYRYGNHSANQWQPIEEPNPQELATLILDEIERHPGRWQLCRATAKALEATANVIQNDNEATRLLFTAISFINFQERNDISDTCDLIGVGINMMRGNVVDAVMIIANRWVENQWPFPDLLVPTLRRFASDPNPAIRALILRRLPYLLSKQPELGWVIFDLALQEEDQRLWEISEPCLYYSYYTNFAKVRPVLDHIEQSTTGKSLETWGRISALAAHMSHVEINDLVSKLQSLESADAWKGAASVWTHHGNIIEQREQCLIGIQNGLLQKEKIAEVIAREMSSLFQKTNEPTVYVPVNIIDLYFLVLCKKNGSDRNELYNFDDWLFSLAKEKPDEAIDIAERFVGYVQQNIQPWYHYESLSKLLTQLFREAEEREEADNGDMLKRVINLQDAFLSIGVNGLHEWLRDAERP